MAYPPSQFPHRGDRVEEEVWDERGGFGSVNNANVEAKSAEMGGEGRVTKEGGSPDHEA